MEILIGKYIIEDDQVIAVRKYKHIPDWISNVLCEAVNHKIEVPNTIIICNYAWPAYTGRMGAYMYKGTNGDLVDAAVCFTYRMELRFKIYTLAHEIGHCDHWKKGIVLESKEEMEDYANSVAELLTGNKLIKSIWRLD